MDDLHWFQRFLHILCFNVIVFGLFYIFFSQPLAFKKLSNEQYQAVRAALR